MSTRSRYLLPNGRSSRRLGYGSEITGVISFDIFIFCSASSSTSSYCSSSTLSSLTLLKVLDWLTNPLKNGTGRYCDGLNIADLTSEPLSRCWA